MTVGLITAEMLVPGARSLKDKRRAIASLKDKLRAHFNVSVAEVDGHETWTRSTLAAVVVGVDGAYVKGVLAGVEKVLSTHRDAVLQRSETRFF